MHHRAFCAFTEGMQDAHPGLVKEWECQVVDWENKRSDFCPYDLPEESTYTLVPLA